MYGIGNPKHASLFGERPSPQALDCHATELVEPLVRHVFVPCRLRRVFSGTITAFPRTHATYTATSALIYRIRSHPRYCRFFPPPLLLLLLLLLLSLLLLPLLLLRAGRSQKKKNPIFTTALIAGDCVILDAIAKAGLLDKIKVVFVDTYFLFPESLDFLHEVCPCACS